MGTHSEKPPPRIIRILNWCCYEGRHVIVELPAGLAAIMAFELLIRPRLMGSHESETAMHIVSNISF